MAILFVIAKIMCVIMAINFAVNGLAALYLKNKKKFVIQFAIAGSIMAAVSYAAFPVIASIATVSVFTTFLPIAILAWIAVKAIRTVRERKETIAQ